MSTGEIVALVAAIVSICIAAFAVWLMITFYKMSMQVSKDIKGAADSIGAGVDRLQKLFDSLYSDTFSLMKDTVSDMRRHMWPDTSKPDDSIDKQAERIADERVSVLKAETDRQLGLIFGRQKATDQKIDDKVDALRQDVLQLVNNAITESSKVEMNAYTATLRENITNRVRGAPDGIIAAQLVDELGGSFGKMEVVDELVAMAKEGILQPYASELEHIGPDTSIRLK